MSETITFDNVDPNLLNQQRLELIKVLDNTTPSYTGSGVLWGLVEMLDDWYDREHNPLEV